MRVWQVTFPACWVLFFYVPPFRAMYVCMYLFIYIMLIVAEHRSRISDKLT